MKYISVLFTFILPISIIAQPSWNSADEASIGDSSIYYSIDSSTNSLSSTTGMNVTWDFSKITTYSFDELPKGQVEDASKNSNANFFSSATHDQFIDNQIHDFYSVSSSDRTAYGLQIKDPQQNLDALITYDGISTRSYPFAYPDKLSGNFSNGKLVMNPNSILESSFNAFGSYSVEADGYGTLTLVDSVISDVLRINVRDSIFADLPVLNTNITVVRNQYEYIAPGNAFPILAHSHIRIYGSLFNQDVTYVLSQLKPNISTGLNEVYFDSNVNIYPNPANNFIYINATSETINSIELFDIQGNRVISLNANAQDKNIQVNIESLTKGMYFVKINSNSGDSQVQKLMVR